LEVFGKSGILDEQSFKEYIKIYEACLIIRRNCYCLVFVIKSNQSVDKRWFALEGVYFTHNFPTIIIYPTNLFCQILNTKYWPVSQDAKPT